MTLSPDDIDELYRGHAERLLAFLSRRTLDPDTAIDLLAETFAVALRDRRSYRGRTDAEAVGWLYGIARHQLSGWYRRGAVERRAMTKLGIERRELTEVEYERIVDLAGLADLRGRVAAEVEQLGGESRSALRLRVVEECSYAEVAAALGVSEQTARARVSRALRQLASRLTYEEVIVHG
jgi:RNA polymerase sigma-70 factor (ECF subfamily)